jgi:Icc-related predicted phosphoesterase
VNVVTRPFVGTERVVPLKPTGSPSRDGGAETLVRIAAAGDVHITEANAPAVAEAFRAIDSEADLILIAGDLTTHGEPEQGALLAQAVRGVKTPIYAVLGNHDLHVNRGEELIAALSEGGINVLDRSCATVQTRSGASVGIVGVKGFVGGFPGSHLPDFGEPSLRRVYAETTAEVEALEAGLRAVETCPFRIVLMHYAPTTDTLIGEPEPIWAFLGSDRLAPPIIEHSPDLVLHGHAHAGTFEGALADVPVFNVSVPVMQRDFWVFELTAAEKVASGVH